MCAHVLAASSHRGSLIQTILKFNPKPSSYLPKQEAAGRKPSDKVRKRAKNDSLQRQDFRNPWEGGDDAGTTQQVIKLVALADTMAYKCYGCGDPLRESAQHPPPPPPNDIVLRTVLHRVHRKRGSIKLCITKDPEPVYIHMDKSCCLLKNVAVTRGNLDTNNVVLTYRHKQQLLKEFGICY